MYLCSPCRQEGLLNIKILDILFDITLKRLQRVKTMKGTLILAAFFSVFLLASLLLPLPMFPGNLLCAFIGVGESQYMSFLSALLNGIFYGALLWLVFITISRRLENER